MLNCHLHAAVHQYAAIYEIIQAFDHTYQCICSFFSILRYINVVVVVCGMQLTIA